MVSYSKKYHPAAPDPQTMAAFAPTPWAKALYFDPSFTTTHNTAHVANSSPGGARRETFSAVTLATASTIRAQQTFIRTAPNSDNGSGAEIVFLIALGSGVNGHVDTCHGGFVSYLLDEVIGSALEVEQPRGTTLLTASLKVDYKRPVRTPGTVLCRGWVDRREGRKVWGKGAVEDGEGGLLATGEALFVLVEVGRGKL